MISEDRLTEIAVIRYRGSPRELASAMYDLEQEVRRLREENERLIEEGLQLREKSQSHRFQKNRYRKALGCYAKESNWRCYQCSTIGEDHAKAHDKEWFVEDGPDIAQEALRGEGGDA